MPDWEKVIKGLECCMVGDGHSPSCELCPYTTVGDDTCQTMDALFADALALLKAQEPRVMTREEVVKNSELRVVWVERRNGDICAGIYEKCRNTAGGVCAVFFNFRRVPNNGMFSASSYNVSWRCWTSRPTDEQREAVKWDD